MIRDDGKLVEMASQKYDSEDLLQRLLAEYPSLLAGDQIDPTSPRRWLLVSRETGVPDATGAADRWALDHLFLDQDGIPTLVEVKRSSDTRIRREVVGQMLDYAANGVAYWPADQVRSSLASRCEASGSNIDHVLREFLGPDVEHQQFWNQVETNLHAGRIRMVFVADEIPQELRRVVEFLNEQMHPSEVLAVQIRLFAGEGLRTLVPQVFGITQKSIDDKRKGLPGKRKKWDEGSFREALAQQASPDAAHVALTLLDWCKKNAEVVFGTGTARGSFVPSFDDGARGFRPFSVWTDGTLQVQFGYLDKHPSLSSEAARRELASKLNAVPGIGDDELTGWPQFSLTVLADAAGRGLFLDVIAWAANKVVTQAGST
ncbi:MAG: hypothetical protein HS104_26895 [Polyangiaceae bacterium]|nr:hypothetical protein [Polyangiaceae bacterium]